MPKKITIYSRPTCAPCNQIKKFLNLKGLSYEVKDVDADPNNAAEALALAGMSIVPVTVITKQDDTQEVISGLNLSRLMPAIA